MISGTTDNNFMKSIAVTSIMSAFRSLTQSSTSTDKKIMFDNVNDILNNIESIVSSPTTTSPITNETKPENTNVTGGGGGRWSWRGRGYGRGRGRSHTGSRHKSATSRHNHKYTHKHNHKYAKKMFY
jgi:hypothetical protein